MVFKANKLHVPPQTMTVLTRTIISTLGLQVLGKSSGPQQWDVHVCDAAYSAVKSTYM